MPNSYFVTFGFGMPLQSAYAKIPHATTEGAAREEVRKVYGSRWSFVYHLSDLAGQLAQFPQMREVEWGTPNMDPPPLCTGCNRHPAQIGEYVEAAAEANMTPDEYVTKEEGTFNYSNGHFLCTTCYIEAGQPSGPKGWVAP